MKTCLLAVTLGLSVLAPIAQAENKVFNIGYLSLDDDPRYTKKQLYARFLGQALGRPVSGAETALKEVKYHGAELGLKFKLQEIEARKETDLQAKLDQLMQDGAQFILADLPASVLKPLAQANRDKPIALMNVSSADNELRSKACQPNLYHLLPSHAMQTDAIAQYLVSKKWTKLLHLKGKSEADQRVAASFERSAKRFGLKIKETRDFILSNDPRERDKNNVNLLTRGDFDAIFVSDTQGEFARNVPYQTMKPVLVFGAAGLTASAWHWSWERHGAPQLNKRFEKKAKRAMAAPDWAAWIGVKAIAGAVQDTKSTDFNTLIKHITNPDTVLDSFKGHAANFRTWNRQLRQPLLLHTDTWVVERAPLKGFLHQKNNLDTLGLDERESGCS